MPYIFADVQMMYMIAFLIAGFAHSQEEGGDYYSLLYLMVVLLGVTTPEYFFLATFVLALTLFMRMFRDRLH